MKLLQVTILCLLSSLCSSEESNEPQIATASHLENHGPGTQTISTSALPTSTTNSTTPNLVVTSAAGMTPKGTTNEKPVQTFQQTTLPSLTPTFKGAGDTTNGVTKDEFITTNATVTNFPIPTIVSTLPTSQHKTENQSSIKTTKLPVSTPQPDASFSKTNILSSVSTTISENISQSQGNFENAKNASPSSTSPSYSSVILPVVIALIVITLSAFALVGLYRICRKTDPGTPENGNDQPQSDKESVKLLTVKTISHESGDHFAQGKSKN